MQNFLDAVTERGRVNLEKVALELGIFELNEPPKPVFSIEPQIESIEEIDRLMRQPTKGR